MPSSGGIAIPVTSCVATPSNYEDWTPSPEPSPEELSRAAKGDAEEFAALVERYQRMAYSIAYKILGNQADAEDAAQDAFLRCYRAMGQFRGDSTFSTWFFRIVVRAAIDIRRREHRHLPPTAVEEKAAEDPSHTSALVAALDALPDDYRIPTVLRDVYGLSYQEIAELTARPLGTVKVMVHRGRAVLRLRLRAEGLVPQTAGGG